MTEAVAVKICGVTNLEDAQAALEAGAQALGFNLYPGSKRHVRLEEVAGWIGTLAATRVAVMVNPPLEEARRAQEVFGVVQLHGDESPQFCAELSATGRVWKALPLRADVEAGAVSPFPTEAILIDAFVPGAFGGTGQLIDLARAAEFAAQCEGRELWLSGGLTPENVGEAVRRVRPHGVDVASGVESAGNPRRKDAARMKAFIQAARRA